jgi:hypothetical protein
VQLDEVIKNSSSLGFRVIEVGVRSPPRSVASRRRQERPTVLCFLQRRRKQGRVRHNRRREQEKASGVTQVGAFG